MKDWIHLLARLCLSVIFLFEAYDTAYYKTIAFQTLEGLGVRLDHNLVYWGSITLLVLGSLLLLLGYRLGLAALLLLIYIVPYTLIVHNFWHQTDQPTMREQAIHFMKNLGIIGGLLVIWSSGGGRFSLRRILASTKS